MPLQPRLEKDPITGIIKKEGWTVIPNPDIQAIGLETIARHLAAAEGKDFDNSTIARRIKRRLTSTRSV